MLLSRLIAPMFGEASWQPTHSKGWLFLESWRWSTIKIQLDKWIPNHPTNRVLYLANEEVKDWMVSDLIDPDMNWWR